jgi:hypothetical protein
MDEMKRRIPIMAGVAMIGVGLGYLGGFIQFLNETHHGSQYSSWEHEWLMLPALPGILISSILCPYDYRLTEQWSRDKHSTAVWNGLVFAALTLPPAVLIKRRREASNNDSEPTLYSSPQG